MQNFPPHTHFLQSATSLQSLKSPLSFMFLLRKQDCHQGNKRYPPLQEKIFGLSIFLFAQNLWRAVMKNGNLYNTLTAGEVSHRLTKKPPLSKGGLEGM